MIDAAGDMGGITARLRTEVNGFSVRANRAEMPDNGGMTNDATTGRAASALKAMRERSGLSVGEVARLLGKPKSTYSEKEREFKRPYLPMDWVLELAKIFPGKGTPAITVEEVMALGGPPPPGLEPNATIIPGPVENTPKPMGAMDVPVYGRAQGGDDGFFEINLAEGPLEYVERPASLANVKEVFAILVHGTSMDPVWIPDDVVYVVPSRPVKPGDYVVVQIERGPGQQPASLLKRFCRRDNNRVVLEQHNPPQQVTLPRAQVKEMWRALHWREVK